LTQAHITDQELALLASGVKTGVTPEASATDAEAKAAAEAATAEAARLAAEKEATDKAAADKAEQDRLAAEGQAPVVDLLKAQLKEKDGLIVALNVDKTALNAQVEGLKGAHDGLLAIARQSVENMTVALGGSKPDLSTLDATAVLAQHATLEAKFKERFKVGGVAAAAPQKDEPKGEVADPLRTAQLAAVRPGKR
jgi:hypothetical protein